MAQGQPGAPPSAGGSGLPEMNLQTLTQRILATSPQVRNHPEILMAALERAAPILDRQSKEDLADLRKEMQTRSLEQRSQIANAQLEAAKTYHAQVSADRQAAESGRQGRFEVAEQRRQASAAVRDDQGYQRLQLATNALAQRAQDSGNRDDLARWRASLDAQHKYATEVIQANSAMSNLSKADKKALLDEQRANRDAALEAMRARGRSTTPTGGTAPEGAPVAPKIQGQLAPGQPGATPPTVIPPAILQQAQGALKAGAPREAVIKRLQEQGYPTDGL